MIQFLSVPVSVRNRIIVAVVLLLSVAGTFFKTVAQDTAIDRSEIEFYQAKNIQPFISSEQDGDYPAGTYLVLHDLKIAKGKIMTLYPGTKILFVKDSRLIVEGLLICQGKGDEQVVFDKLDNRDYYQPVDSTLDTWWNGVYVADSATIEMKHAWIKNSKYGLVIDNAASSVNLDTVYMQNNKYHSLRFGDELPNVADQRAFRVMWSGLDGKRPDIIYIDTIKKPSIDQAIPQGQMVSVLSPEEKKLKKKKQLGWTFGTAALVSAGAGALSLFKALDAQKVYESPENQKRGNTDAGPDPDYITNKGQERFSWLYGSIGAGTLFLVSATGFTLTLWY
ncbi:MAG: hypothetical protein ACM31E_02055 [Fibrobacterota bacterium]|nr:hypothetical protein [Chitinispirillaceae bacterium]